MQQGLCALVQQVNDATTAMVENINELAQNNKQLYQQSAKQSEELSSVTSHISLLEMHVEDNSGFAELANQRAVQARDVAAGGDRMMATVNTSMQAIVTRSSEMRGLQRLSTTLHFRQISWLLTRQSRQHMLGSKGVGLPWLQRSWAAGAKKRSVYAKHSDTD